MFNINLYLIISPIVEFLLNKQEGVQDDIKKLLPDGISSKAYVSSEVKKYNNNKPLKTQNDNNKKIRIYIPVYEGKVYDPTTNKIINVLKKSEDQIIKELSKLNYNEKLLKSKSYINLFNTNPKNLSSDQKTVDERIKSIEKSKNNCMVKLEELKNRINILQFKQDKELGILDNNKKLKLNKFVEDCNNKKSNQIIEQKIKKLHEESEKIQLIMKKDLEKQFEKKNNELNELEKAEEQKRIDILKNIRKNERKDIEKRKKKNNEELLKFKMFINKKPTKAYYLYQKHKDDYVDKVNNLVKEENIRRKAYMKHIDLNEFDEMKKNYDQQKSKRILESNEKIKIIKESWSERHKLIPIYSNPVTKLVADEENKMKQAEQDKILRRKELKKIQKNYCVPKPLKVIKEKVVDESQNMSYRRPKPHLIKSNSYSDILRQKAIDKYKAEKIKKEKMLSEEEDSYLDEPIIIDNKGNKRKNSNNSKHAGNKSVEKNKFNKEVLDYLKERRKINELNKEKKRNEGELTKMDYSGTNDIKKLIKENGINDNMLKVAKCKLESIDEKKRQKDLLLKLSGGVANKPELGEEVCDLMIDSIQAKLSLIKEIDKDLDESYNEEKNDNDKAHVNIVENDEENNNYEDEEEDN